MSSLLLLALCAAAPWISCAALRALLSIEGDVPMAARERALGDYRRATLIAALLVLPASAIAGALLADPVLASRWPTSGSWFFAALCATTAWSSLALAQRTPEEAAAMPWLETVGRAVQMSFVPALAVGLSLLAFAAVESLVPLGPVLGSICAALLSVGATLVASPSLAVTFGFWRLFPRRVEVDGVSWRLAHLPAPAPFFTHAAALPWLRTALVSDGLFSRAPDQHWRTLVQYEIGGALRSRGDRAARWAVAVTLSVTLFLAAASVGATDPRKRVAAMVLAVLFTSAAAWLANRHASSKVSLDPSGPSMQELAQTLRSLPPCHGQALPRTSLRPLGSALYDRLYALGHDPGRRPHA